MINHLLFTENFYRKDVLAVPPSQASFFLQNMLKENSVYSIQGLIVLKGDAEAEKAEILAFLKNSYAALKPDGTFGVEFRRKHIDYA